MIVPLKNSDLIEKLPGLDSWGEAEYRLRSLIVTTHKADMRPLLQGLACQDLVRAMYRQIGFPISQEELCPAYDLLRHRRPINYDLLHEARYTLAVVQTYYRRDTPITSSALNDWLRAIVTLTSTIGGFEDANRIGFGGAMDAHMVAAPFDVPPGPLESFRSALREGQSAFPPLLAAVAILNTLEDHKALFPGRLEIAALLLLPGLVSSGFGLAPLAIGQCTDKAGWVQLDQIAATAAAHTDSQLDTIGQYASGMAGVGTCRLGSRVPGVVAAILEQPLFTAKTIAHSIGCVPRTVEKILHRLEASGFIAAMQHSGRLNIWSKR